jgi:environmental stress-induced protein Ves
MSRPGFQILPSVAYCDLPWRNGLGRTLEVARHPETGDRFDWRVSIATIASDGPFSCFAGYDRTLVPIAGGGLALDLADGTTLRAELYEAMRFAGDVAAEGRILGAAPTRDLNVMTRRGICAHDVTIHLIHDSPRPLALSCGTCFLIALDALVLRSENRSFGLGALDALRADEPLVCEVTASGPLARLAVIRIAAS